MYAVIDVETTGLRTTWHDRICEIAVVHVDASGRITGDWSSLVNPERDLGPQHVHGITAAEARRAPVFADLAGQIGALLRERVIVAHNLAFDAAFLVAEYSRLGLQAPVGQEYGLCTMNLAAQLLPSAGRSLRDCCQAAGIPQQRAHSALDDARAAAGLLARYLHRVGTPPPWQQLVLDASTLAWPPLPPAEALPVVRRHPHETEDHFLSRLVDRLPRVPAPPQADSYLSLLDHALLDRHVSAVEADALVEAADALGLDRAQVLDLHRLYLQALAAEAFDDGRVTEIERDDLHTVAALLGLDRADVDRALDPDAGDQQRRTTRPLPAPAFRLLPGDTVVFTGQTAESRELWEERARIAGLTVGRTVTRTTRLLVAADPDTMSGKARQARRHRVPIVHPGAFLSMLVALRVAE
ncbi:exonuclease domain-containing protein [Catellatospora sp. NPDC049133]|uniref:exonuclease domain-containing protein n=1 Tax=Catellatospora sp. NPDC049133 TaxID=3155499 RepID=UPI0033F92656